VITKPLPCMPVGFWNDAEWQPLPRSVFRSISRRVAAWGLLQGQRARRLLRARPFRRDVESHGVRIGTAEVYRALLEVPEIEDSLIVNLDLTGGGFFMPLFVKLREGEPPISRWWTK